MRQGQPSREGAVFTVPLLLSGVLEAEEAQVAAFMPTELRVEQCVLLDFRGPVNI